MPKTYAEGFIGLLILDGADLFFDQWELANRDAFRTHPEIVNRWLFIPGSKPFVEHPRYLEMGAQIGLLDLWKTRGYPMGCLRVQDDAGDHLSCSNWPE